MTLTPFPDARFNNRPTYIEKPRVLAEEEAHELFMQMPSPCPGQELPFLPGAVQSLYEEARCCFTIKAYAAAEQLCRKLMLHVIDTSNAREASKPTPRDTGGFMESARARIIDEASSPELTPTTAANAAASLVLTASMLRMLYLRPEAAE